ncbi:hypothetical protein ACLB2K_005644 [Fragaria x ananassa]
MIQDSIVYLSIGVSPSPRLKDVREPNLAAGEAPGLELVRWSAQIGGCEEAIDFSSVTTDDLVRLHVDLRRPRRVLFSPPSLQQLETRTKTVFAKDGRASLPKSPLYQYSDATFFQSHRLLLFSQNSSNLLKTQRGYAPETEMQRRIRFVLHLISRGSFGNDGEEEKNRARQSSSPAMQVWVLV